MSNCSKCHIQIVGSHNICPLCKNKIEKRGKTDSDIFPKIPTIYELNRTLIVWFLFISFLATIITIFINYIVSSKISWSIFVILGIVSSWLILINIINRKSNLVKLISWQSMLISALALMWDMGTRWHGWSLDFVLPSIFGIGIIATFVIAKIMKFKANDCLIYLIVDILLGFIPLIFLLKGKLNFLWPSISCVLLSSIILLTVIVFETKTILEELKKRLHV